MGTNEGGNGELKNFEYFRTKLYRDSSYPGLGVQQKSPKLTTNV